MKIHLPDHVGFTDGLKQFRLQLQDAARGIAESGSQPSTLNITGGGQRTGDFEPNFSHIEQRTWIGGRGNAHYVDDTSRFFDSRDLTSWFEGKVFPAPKTKFAKGLRTTNEHLSDSIGWLPLTSSNRYASVRDTAGFSGMDKVNLWIKYRGRPGALTVEVRTDSATVPSGVVVAGPVAVDTDDITDTLSLFYEFDWAGTHATSIYHIVVYGASGDDIDNCWLVGVDFDGSGGLVSSNGSSWSAGSPAFKMNYRVTDTDSTRRWLDFDLDGSKYVVSVNDSGSASLVYINGDRGTVTSATPNQITDTGKSWSTGKWEGSRVKIVSGTGKGQSRKIISSGTTGISVAISFDVTPDTTSQYVIYKTPYFTPVSVGGGATWGAVKSVAVINNIAYFALGQSVNMARMRYTAGTHEFADDGTNKADIVFQAHDTTDGPQLYRANNTTTSVSRAKPEAWGTSLTFENDHVVGNTTHLITNLADYDNILWVFKEDGPWTSQNDIARRLNVGTDGLPGPVTGQAVAVHDLFLYFSWWKSLEQLYGGTLDDVGPWADEGLPVGRNGVVSGLASALAWLFVGIDAGGVRAAAHWSSKAAIMNLGTSSVHVYANRSYHEVFRGYMPGDRVRGVFTQENTEDLPRLWIDYNGELLYQDYSLTPLSEEEYPFAHEAVLVSSTYDMGHADTYKFFKEINAFTQNLDKQNIRVEVDYQAGEDVGSVDKWTPTEALYSSPTDSSGIHLGEQTSLRVRFRLQTDDAFTPPIIRSTIIKGYEVLPVKRVWSMRIKASSLRQGGRSADAHELYTWLWEATQRARRVWMYSVWDELDGVLVRIEPPSTLWKFINKASKWTGVFHLTVREM